MVFNVDIFIITDFIKQYLKSIITNVKKPKQIIYRGIFIEHKCICITCHITLS